MSSHTYSLSVKIVFWLLWLLALLVLVVFASFTILMAVDATLMVFWNALVVVAELTLLFIATRHFIRKDIPSSKLLLWMAGAAIALPLVASGGCIVLDGMGGSSLRIGG